MTIIDIHSHLGWDRHHATYDYAGLLADMDRWGINTRVVSALEGVSICGANEAISQFATANPDRIIGCAVINPKLYGAVEHARRAVQLPGIAMVEFNSFEHGYYPDSCEGVLEVMEVVAEAQLPVKAFTGIGAHSLPHQWLKAARAFPATQFILLHGGCFDYGYGCMDLVAREPNLAVETSNQYEVQILHKMLQTVPIDKIYFGTLFPARFTGPALDLLAPYPLSASQRAAIMGANAARLLGLARS